MKAQKTNTNKTKAGSTARQLPTIVSLKPGARAKLNSTRACRLLLALLRLFRLFRFLRLLRFLSHSILSRFNGRKRDTRHARRRATLAISSDTIPADSQRAAPHRHASVIALSTVVIAFCRICFALARVRSRQSWRN